MNAVSIPVLLGAALALAAPGAGAQDANKPIRLVVITAPGGSADYMARYVAERLGHKLGRSVVVENRPGAGGNIATEYVARSAADGTTLLLTSNSHTINPQIFKRAGYDAFKDFVPVIQLTRGPLVVAAGPGTTANTLQEYIAHAKSSSKPGSGSYGTYGIGGAAHIVGEMVREASSANLQHIAYKGAAPAITDALGGQVPVVILSLASATSQIKAGKLRPLAIASSERWAPTASIPTIGESGYRDVAYDVWLGLLAPASTPGATVAKLNAEIAAIVTSAEAREALGAQGMAPVAGSAADFGKYLQQEASSVGRIIKANGITAE